MENGIPKPENSDVVAGAETAPEVPISVDAAVPVGDAKAASMIVVLAKNAAGVRSTVTFLERRGFAAKVATSLNEAVEYFTRKEADKLLLSVNFPHPKVEMLPVLISQSFKIETIVFAEETDRKSSNRLSNSKSKHVLFGPVSGPVVMMKIRQIDQEIQGVADDAAAEEKRAGSSKEDEGDIKIGGKKSSNDDTVSVSGKTSKTAEKKTFDNLMKTLDEEETDETSESSSGLERSGDTYVAKGVRSKMMSAGGGGDVDDEGGLLTPEAQALRAALDRGLTEIPPGKKPKLIMPLPRLRKLLSIDQASSEDEFEEARPLAELSDAEKAALSPEDKIQRCLREALAIVAGTPQTNLQQLKEHAQAALITLQSSQLSCAFVVSLNYAKQTSGELFHRMELSFFSLLRDHGVEFENTEVFSILLDNMNVVQSAFAESEFAIVTQNPDIEMGAARVFVNNPKVTTEPYEENMHSINLRDLPLDSAVTFSLFLHLKQNQKFIRYLKKGSLISADQITRLETHKAQGLVEKQEVEAYRRHYAAHAILDTKKRVA